MLRMTWRWLRRGLTLGMLLLLLVRLLPADPHPNSTDSPAPAADKKKPKHTNRLAREASPYLLQHAHNPVEWYPWGEEAFAKAKKEGKLVFLSIGYSSCHWCHVMERESFENEEIAKILNRDFVCIKVDREERPDIDNVYMTALQVIPPGQGGGWPLSMFLTAEGKPVIGGTYWAPEDKKINGALITGFKSVLKLVQEAWKDQRKQIEELADKNADRTRRALVGLALGTAIVPLDRELVKAAVEEVKDSFDPQYGGFGSPPRNFRGPKFPTPPRLALLQHEARRQKSKELEDMVALTLDRMARGGIYDQLGGGFHRYSTERTWTVPHFEKMLYDNAQLCEIYAEAYQTTKKAHYRRVLEQTIAFIAREMTASEGGFYSALDADSQGEEGRFYVWTSKQIDAALADADKSMAALFKRVYGLDGEPNFESRSHIPTLPRPFAEQANDLKLTEEQLDARLAPLRDKLFQARAKRPRPFLDTKILTAWNGQMIAGLAVAGQALGDKKVIERAARAAEFLRTHMGTPCKGRVMRCYSAVPGEKAEARLNSYLDDYAFLVHGLLCLHDATSDKLWLDWAKELTEVMERYYADEKNGGFFYTSNDHDDREKLFARSKEQYDGAQPSSNSMAARNLVRLWKKTGDDSYRRLAEKTFRALAGPLKEKPGNLTALADALALYLEAKAAPKK